MDTSLQRLRYLFLRHQAGEATADERSELMEIIRAGGNEAEIQQLIDEAISGGTGVVAEATGVGGEQLSEDRAEAVFSNIIAAGASQPVRRPVRRMSIWIGWTAAAAVVIVLLVRFFYFGGVNKALPVVAGPVLKYDQAPGRKAAMLTLADGRQISLDSTGGGTIGRQGNNTVINLKGALAYNAAGPAVSSRELGYNTLSTNTGNQYRLILPDGSRVWLNAESSVKFPVNFGNRERNLEITGEAYFEIAPDARRPFMVHYKDMTVQVLGTSFDVNAYTDESAVATTLVEGAVKVVNGGDQSLIAPGQQVQVNGRNMKVVSGVNTDEIVAWKDEEFYFRRADIRSIMRQLARWYNIKVDYEGENITERFYARIPRSAPMSEALNALSLTGKVHFKTGERTVTVIK